MPRTALVRIHGAVPTTVAAYLRNEHDKVVRNKVAGGKFGANGDRDGLVVVDAGELVNVLEIRPETTLTPLGSIVNISVRSAAQAIHIFLVEVATVAVEAKVAKAQ